MDEKTESRLTGILFTALIIVLVFSILQNLGDPWVLLLLAGFLAVSFTVRNALLYPSENLAWLGRLTTAADIALIFIITRYDAGTSTQIFYYILIADAVIAYSYIYSAAITLLSFLAYALGRYLTLDAPPFFGFAAGMSFHSLAFICVFAIMYAVKYEIRQSEKLKETMYALKIKTKQLENTYMKLKETSKDLEEMTILKERNRIAREIHDTVGHTLTTVLLEMEAGERLLPVNTELAVEKLHLAKGQVRKGLNDIRESVRTLQAGREIMDFVPSLKLLMEETIRNGSIYIADEISQLPQLTEAQQKAIYRALQEGLTNGIKHSGSTAFVFKLKYEKDYISFFLQDNGAGTDRIIKGFGLTAMEERIKELGGSFNISSSLGEGCCIKITIPAGEEKANG